MISVSFQDDLKPWLRLINGQRKQLPFATALALTKAGQVAHTAINAQLRTKLERPTPTTLRAFELIAAQKKDYPNCFAALKFRDAALTGLTGAQKAGRARGGGVFLSGIPYSVYLGPQFESGPRRHKPFEKRLIAAGILPPSMYAAPGRDVQLDRFGNLRRGELTQMLSQLQTFREAGFDANETQRSKAKRKRRGGAGYFLLRGREGKVVGIARRKSSAVQVYLAFVSRPSYTRRIDFRSTVEGVARRALPGEFKRALETALRTARR